MEMEITETPQGNNNNKTIICPIITVWILFLINIIDLNSSTSYRYYTLTIFLLIYLLSTLLLLVVGILITLGIEKGKYKLYHIGFIVTIVYALVKIFLRILLIMRYPNYFINSLIYLLLDLIPFIVLLLYRKKVKENSQDTEVVRNINIDLQEGNNQLIQ